LKRGRAQDAQAAIAEANDHWHRAENEPRLVETAILAGSAWIDLGRLDEAETVLGAALAAARSSPNGAAARVSLALARCVFWRGRYADAAQSIAHAPQADDRTLIQTDVLRSRIAVGLGDLPVAVGTALESVARARTFGDASLVAASTCGAAFAHLAVGDLDACERGITECLAAVHATH